MTEGRLARGRRVTRGMRFRATLAAVLSVGVVLVVAAVLLAVSTRQRLETAVTERAETRAVDLAALVSAGAVDELPGRYGDLFGQVVAADGTVVASSPEVGGLPPFAALRPGPGEIEMATNHDLFGSVGDQVDDLADESPYRIVAVGAESGGQPVTILVAASIESAEQAVRVLVPLLALVLPVVLAIVAAVVWLLIGRGLRPVELMTSEARLISAEELSSRLAVPRSGDEIERLAATLNEMLAGLHESAERQRRFVSDASHELKSPVAAIAAMLDVADSEGFDDWEPLLTDLRREDQRLDALVSDLLVLAQLDERHATFERRDLDLDQIIGREVDLLRRTQEREIDATGLQPIQVIGDKRALSHLFRNLLDNASRNATTTVWVDAAVTADRVHVTISDDGRGVAEADRERVFERFLRLDDSRSRDSGGTGLGLTVSRALAVAMDGDVRFVDPLRGGATVLVDLPAGE